MELPVCIRIPEGRFLMVNGRRYRGRATAYRDAQGVTAVNVVPLESYVAGVIGREIDEWETAHAEYVRIGHVERAEVLRQELEVLRGYVGPG